MQDGVRASRFTRFSQNKMFTNSIVKPKKGDQSPVREPTVIGQYYKNTNFDYLGLRDEENKLYKRVNFFLEKNGENQH